MKTISIFIIAIILGSCGTKSKTENKQENTKVETKTETKAEALATDFTAESFTDLWWNNPSDALEKYTNTEVTISGVLARDGQTDNVYFQGSKDSKLFVLCKAASGSDFSTFKKDELIKLKGVSTGMTMSVNLKECSLVK